MEVKDDLLSRKIIGRPLADDAAVDSWRLHVYSPLNAERRQIRILKLFPTEDLRHDPEGELWTLDLIDATNITTPKLAPNELYSREHGRGTFAALSYAWGDPTLCLPMLLNGRSIKIARNSHSALRYLRRSKVSINIWIDSICINQADVRERSQQVSLMKDIYSLACPVYIWTGQGLKYAYRALSVLARMAITIEEAYSMVDSNRAKEKDAIWKAMERVSDTDWDHLATFLNQSIWRRVWVQQEIILSSPHRRMAIVVAGRLELNHCIFTHGLRALAYVWEMLSEPDYFEGRNTSEHPMKNAVRVAFSLCSMQSFWTVHGSIPDGSLISTMHDMEATDAKDYIYGLLGLLPYIAPSPDYRKPIAEVYANAMFNILKHSGALNLILGMSHHYGEVRDSMPTWVRDWRERSDGNFRERWADIAAAYNACNKQTVQLRLDGYRLGVGIHVLFTVHEENLGPINDLQYLIMRPPIAQREFALQKLGLVRNLDPNSHPTFNERFERTMLLDLSFKTVDGSSQRLASAGNDDPAITAACQIMRASLEGLAGDNEHYAKACFRSCDRLRNTRIAVSPNHQMCILPAKAQSGDVACILAGSSIPFLLRPVDSHAGISAYQVVGGAYIEGVMDGEAIVAANRRASEGGHKVFVDSWLV